jgi:CAAX protease family protein
MPNLSVAAQSTRQAVSLPTIKRLPSSGPWGFWATVGWVALALVVSSVGLLFFRFGQGIQATRFEHTAEDPGGLVVNVLFVLFLTGAARCSRLPARNYFALRRPRPIDVNYWGAGVAIGAAVTATELILAYRFGLGVSDARYLPDAYNLARSAGTLPLLWAAVVISAPVCEELVFRGFLFRGWSQTSLGPVGAIVLTAVLFGLMHVQYSWLGILDIMGFGLVAGWMRWRTESIVAPMLLHFTNNLTWMVILTLGLN